MMAPYLAGATLSRLGPAGAPTPIVIAVPHAGRHYPDALLAAARLPREALETIEDRYADLLIADAVAAGAIAIVARTARALVDLNRDPREIDPGIVRRDPGGSVGGDWLESEKVAGGLGVVPSRIAAGGAVWKHPLDTREIAARIDAVHRPYHAAIGAALDAAHARHGIAILIDCHSMPPIGAAARVVIGDRHGASAAPRYVQAAIEAVSARGLTIARNRPYAGGFTLDRHGAPRRGRHALQIELDRTLYLDPVMRRPGPGLAAGQALIGAIAAALRSATRATPLAAE